jgi:signal transduction histidine kinase
MDEPRPLVRLLLIDAAPEARQELRALLADHPEGEVRIVEASTAREGLRFCQSERPDCILCDLYLPDLDVPTFLGELASLSFEPLVPVILLVPDGHEREALEAHRFGAAESLGRSEMDAPTLRRLLCRVLEKSRLEKALLEQRRELEAFTHTAAHDLQAPLRRITSFCDLIHRDLVGKLDERTSVYLGHVIENAAHLSSLVQNLLEYCRAGRSRPHVQDVSLDRAVDRALQNLEVVIKESRATIHRQRLPLIPGDPATLEQLFQNLISNAIKFRGDGSPVIHIEAAAGEGGHRITVRDHGIGIDPRHHDMIFAPFKRLHSRTQVPGTGIGLAICRRIVEHHRGTISVESEPGCGTAFHVVFPLASPETGSGPWPEAQGRIDPGPPAPA